MRGTLVLLTWRVASSVLQFCVCAGISTHVAISRHGAAQSDSEGMLPSKPESMVEIRCSCLCACVRGPSPLAFMPDPGAEECELQSELCMLSEAMWLQSAL